MGRPIHVMSAAMMLLLGWRSVHVVATTVMMMLLLLLLLGWRPTHVRATAMLLGGWRSVNLHHVGWGRRSRVVVAVPVVLAVHVLGGRGDIDL